MFFLGSGEKLEGLRPRLLNYLCPLHWKHGVLTTGPLWNSLYYFLYCTYFSLHFSSLFFLPFIIWNIQLFIFRSFYLAINFLINTALPASFKFSFMLFAFSFIQIISLSFPLKKKNIYRHFEVSCSISKHWRDLSNIFLFYFNSIRYRHYTFVWLNLSKGYWEVFYILNYDQFWWIFHVQLMLCVSGLCEMDVP